jgi:uncharacterized protein YdaU (DUF1376 family)
MSKPWMPFYVADYLADTGHLNAAQHGAYLMLIMHYWRKGSIPADTVQQAQIARMSEADWLANRDTVLAFFDADLKHKRIDQELAHAEDVSNKRRTARAQRSNNSSTIVEQKTTQSQSQSQSQRKKEDIRAVANATRPSGDHFDKFKAAYPRRKGSNPWKPARVQFDIALKSGADPAKIIAAVRAGVGYDTEKINTEYIPQAVKWLRDRRWEDHQPVEAVALTGFYAVFGSPQLEAWDKTKPGGYPRDKAGGWRFPTEWPPGKEQAA